MRFADDFTSPHPHCFIPLAPPMYDRSCQGINHHSRTRKVTHSIYRVDDAVSVCVEKQKREGECPSHTHTHTPLRIILAAPYGDTPTPLQSGSGVTHP